VEINAVGASVLLLLLHNIDKGTLGRVMSMDQKLFRSILIMNLLIFLFDSGMWVADGRPGQLWKSINYIVTTVYYLYNPLISFFLLLYADFKIHESRTDLLRRCRFYIIPVCVCSVMTLASPFTGWFFSIDARNRYSHGNFFIVMVLSSFFYLSTCCIMAFRDYQRNRRSENKRIDLHLAFFSLVIIIAAGIQSLFFGISIIWVCSMLACTGLYINIQNDELSTDHLTGLYNRRRLEQHLQRRTKGKRKSLLFLLMFDLDGFKIINDKFGHTAGDEALVRVARLLQQACGKSEDFLARMGGDEFIIVGERSEKKEIEQLMKKIHTLMETFNAQRLTPYTLEASMGYAVLEERDTLDSFYMAADESMYYEKQRKKLEKNTIRNY
jgi:diguanylate cyclase (GGDEF)-like protein